MHYLVVGISHKITPIEIREKLAIPEHQMGAAVTHLVAGEDVQEAMLLSTCNRVEACLVAKHSERGVAAARRLIAEWGGMKEGELTDYLYQKEGGEAIAHLFRVTASLDSMVVGEPQISGQVKAAYTQAVSHNTTGPYLNRWVHRALNVAKKIRTETSIGQYPVSVGYAAVVLATKIFDNLREKKVLVVGAGEMSELTCRHLKERQVAKIWVSNRTRAKAEELAEKFEGEVVDPAAIGTILAEVDILLSSVEGDQYVVTVPQMKEAIGRRKGRAMFLIDLGVPRNIDPLVNQIENVYLYDIDDLRGIVTANQGEREKAAIQAEEIIAAAVKKFQRDLRDLDVAPTIRGLSKKFDLIRRKELERFFSKHPDFTSEQQGEIAACASAILNKILHEPIILMKTEEAKDGQPKYSEILKKLFRLEGD